VTLPPFQKLVDEHGAALYRFLYFSLGPHDAADCYQDTMAAAICAYPKLKHQTNLRSWLFTIAHRKAVDSGRSLQRSAVPMAAVPERAAPAQRETDDELWAAVGDLPGGQRDAVLFRFVGDLSYAEVARVLGCSEGAARQRVKEGIAKLREVVR
jgi:RNA polymerase sigma factor (sigma-70 family)